MFRYGLATWVRRSIPLIPFVGESGDSGRCSHCTKRHCSRTCACNKSGRMAHHVSSYALRLMCMVHRSHPTRTLAFTIVTAIGTVARGFQKRRLDPHTAGAYSRSPFPAFPFPYFISRTRFPVLQFLTRFSCNVFRESRFTPHVSLWTHWRAGQSGEKLAKGIFRVPGNRVSWVYARRWQTGFAGNAGIGQEAVWFALWSVLAGLDGSLDVWACELGLARLLRRRECSGDFGAARGGKVRDSIPLGISFLRLPINFPSPLPHPPGVYPGMVFTKRVLGRARVRGCGRGRRVNINQENGN